MGPGAQAKQTRFMRSQQDLREKAEAKAEAEAHGAGKLSEMLSMELRHIMLLGVTLKLGLIFEDESHALIYAVFFASDYEEECRNSVDLRLF